MWYPYPGEVSDRDMVLSVKPKTPSTPIQEYEESLGGGSLQGWVGGDIGPTCPYSRRPEGGLGRTEVDANPRLEVGTTEVLGPTLST